MARAREKRGADEAAAARDEKADLEARAHGALQRCESLGEKVRASRDARLHAQQVLEQREAELLEARSEIARLQGQFGGALERQLAMHGAATGLGTVA